MRDHFVKSVPTVNDPGMDYLLRLLALWGTSPELSPPDPVTLPLYIGSQLNFLAVYLLTDYYTLVRRTYLLEYFHGATCEIDRTAAFTDLPFSFDDDCFNTVTS